MNVSLVIRYILPYKRSTCSQHVLLSVIALFSKDEINIASKTRMDTVFLGCKPLKSSEDEIDLLQSS